jgi:GTPase SAR1 family protein
MDRLLSNVIISEEDDDPSFKVISSICGLYNTKVIHLERLFGFNEFYEQLLGGECVESEFAMKPTVLFIGAYSTGKTSFIRQLLGKEYLDSHIAPEPSTDRFNALIYGDEEITVNGTVLTGLSHLPFQGLTHFGLDFINRMVATTVQSPILKHINIIDTPGVLAGLKQANRGYDFGLVARWFGQRSDLIILMFDCSKTDISDELMETISQLQDYHGRVRCVLNKVDMLDIKEIVRVYGALMWSLGRTIQEAEVTRVYMAHQIEDHSDTDGILRKLGVENDQKALTSLISNIHKSSLSRKVGNLFKRCRLLRAHILILQYLRRRSPWIFEFESTKQARISQNSLVEMYDYLTTKYDLPQSDFPPIELMTKLLRSKHWKNVPTDKKYLHMIQDIVLHDIKNISQNLFSALDVTKTTLAPTKPAKSKLPVTSANSQAVASTPTIAQDEETTTIRTANTAENLENDKFEKVVDQ